MRKPADFVRLVWAMLLLALVQSWGAVTHMHALPETRAAAVVADANAVAPAAAAAAAAATAAIADTDEAPDDGTTDCHCLWCSPRLHLLLSVAIVARLLRIVLRLLSRVWIDLTVPTWRTRFLSPPPSRAPPALHCAAA
ncbi:hypothetical protein [Cupriavidus necator]|uniref:hypothetical protein n=1 Tax=Cupriavidus necator TaxID=106590 RepID=UPI00339D506F